MWQITSKLKSKLQFKNQLKFILDKKKCWHYCLKPINIVLKLQHWQDINSTQPLVIRMSFAIQYLEALVFWKNLKLIKFKNKLLVSTLQRMKMLLLTCPSKQKLYSTKGRGAFRILSISTVEIFVRIVKYFLLLTVFVKRLH